MMAALAPLIVQDEAPGIVASVERIDAWMEVANPGDRFIYATRLCLPVRSAGAARMRALSDRGLVLLTQPRSKVEPSLFHYMATRSSKSSAITRLARPVLAAPSAPIGVGEAEAVDRLLPVLARFAAMRRPCPTDRQLAERARLPEAAIQPALAAMAGAHLIRIQGVSPPTYRRIVIVETGAITGLAA